MDYDNWLTKEYDDQCKQDEFLEYLESEGITEEEYAEQKMNEPTGGVYDGFKKSAGNL